MLRPCTADRKATMTMGGDLEPGPRNVSFGETTRAGFAMVINPL